MSSVSVSYFSFHFDPDQKLRNLLDAVCCHKGKCLDSPVLHRVEKTMLRAEHNLLFIVLCQIHCCSLWKWYVEFFTLISILDILQFSLTSVKQLSRYCNFSWNWLGNVSVVLALVIICSDRFFPFISNLIFILCSLALLPSCALP